MKHKCSLGERDSLITRDQEERQKAMYKYKRVEKFRRQQSPLWNAIHPSVVSRFVPMHCLRLIFSFEGL